MTVVADGGFNGRVVLVTGGARGQGAAEGALLRQRGAEVVLTDVTDEAGQAEADLIGATYLHLDVADPEQWDDVIASVMGTHGRLDGLVNNAGVWRSASLADTTLEMFREVIEINQVGVFLGMQAAARVMTRPGGSIVNISSVAGLRAAAGGFAYGASKFAVTGMTKSAAMELARHNVRVNSIHPGMIETDMITEVTGGSSERHDRFARSVPLKRPADPSEVAKLALFLASDDSSYCTGSEFVVDGGMTAG